MQPASSFRDFERQQLIWNGKFNGERKVHDDAGNPLDLASFDDWQKHKPFYVGQRFLGKSSSLGNRNRYFDPDLLPQGQSLQLEPWEYESGGYFFELSEFLTENLPHFEFALPFISQPEGKKVGREPWHISYYL